MTVSGAFGGGVALITGGSQGLGYAVAERLISEGAAGLLLVGRDPVKGVAAAASLSSLDCRPSSWPPISRNRMPATRL